MKIGRAKQCALIAVNEILSLTSFELMDGGYIAITDEYILARSKTTLK